MAIQQARDVIVAFKAQAALGTEEPGGAGATKFLYKGGSQGFSPPQATPINSDTNFGDGQTSRARRGTYNVPGQMIWEAMTGGAHDLLYPLFFRNDYAAAVTITQAEMSSATLSVSSNVITFSGGDIIAQGVKDSDVIKFTSGLDAADNNKWLRVKSVTATSITVYETITDVAGPVASYSLTVPKKLVQGTARKLITVEEYFANIDRSLVLHDVTGNSLRFGLTENQTLDVTGDFLGAGYAYKDAAGSPHFTSPTETASESLAFLDACFAINGADRLTVTGFSVDLNLNAQTLAVANKTGKSPDVFQGNGKPTGQFSMALEDFTELQAAAGETQIDFLATFLDPNGTGVLHLALTNVIMLGEQLTPLGQDGAAVATFNMDAGRDTRGGAFDKTGIKLQIAA